MNIAHKKPYFFQVARTARDTININSGVIHLSNPRMHTIFVAQPEPLVVGGGEQHSVTLSDGVRVSNLVNNGFYSNALAVDGLDIYDFTQSGISQDCNIYLKINPWIMTPFEGGLSRNTTYSDDMTIGNGTNEEPETAYNSFNGIPMFKDYQVNRYRGNFGQDSELNWINRCFSYVVQPEDPEDDSHDASKNFDTISFVDGYVSGACQTHLLIAEITFQGDSMVINQRHRGPLSLSLPKIYWGDFDHRPNIA